MQHLPHIGRRSTLALLAALAAPACAAPQAEESAVGAEPAPLMSATLLPIADTSIATTYAFENSGGAPSLYAGGDGRGGRRRALLRFDLTGLPPASRATIVRATLHMRLTNVPDLTPRDSSFVLRRMTQSWVEGAGSNGSHGVPCELVGGATHRTRDCVRSWSQTGGAFDPIVFATAEATGRYVGAAIVWDSLAPGNEGFVGEIAALVALPCANLGWMLTSDAEDMASTVRGFGSREGASRPALQIDYACLPGFDGADCLPVTDGSVDDASSVDAAVDDASVDAAVDDASADAAVDDAGTDASIGTCPVDEPDASVVDAAHDAGSPPQTNSPGGCRVGGSNSAGDSASLFTLTGLALLASRVRLSAARARRRSA